MAAALTGMTSPHPAVGARARLWWRRAFACAMLALLVGCASPIPAKVTLFHDWPADAAGATFAFAGVEGVSSELEQRTYQGYVADELRRLGLRAPAPGDAARFTVAMAASGATREKKVLQPIYEHQQVWVPPRRDGVGNVYPGYWAPDGFGLRWVGDREVTRTVQVSRVRIQLLDARAGTTDRPRAVWEATAVYEGDNEDLPDLLPYLVRAAFDGFPGASGRVRVLRFDPKTGERLSR